MSVERFDELFERYRDRGLNESERAELLELMRDPAVRAQFVRVMNMDTLLAEEFGLAALSPLRADRPTRRPRERSVVWRTPLAAAALVGVAVLLFVTFRSSPSVPPTPETKAPIASTPAVSPVGRVVAIEGAPLILRGDSKIPAQPGGPVNPEDHILTAKGESVRWHLADGSEFNVQGETSVNVSFTAASQRLVLERGELSASVKPQPADRPLLIATSLSEVRIVGTRFSVAVSASGTTLKVDEGHVRVTRLSDRAEVDVKTGSFIAVSSAALPLQPLALPVITSFSLVRPDTGKPIKGFEALPPDLVIPFGKFPGGEIGVLVNTQGTVSSVRFDVEGKPVVLSKPPFVLQPADARRVLRYDSKTEVRFTLKAVPFSGPRATGVAGAPFIHHGTIVAPR